VESVVQIAQKLKIVLNVMIHIVLLMVGPVFVKMGISETLQLKIALNARLDVPNVTKTNVKNVLMQTLFLYSMSASAESGFL
jgi:hypothetical protein